MSINCLERLEVGVYCMYQQPINYHSEHFNHHYMNTAKQPITCMHVFTLDAFIPTKLAWTGPTCSHRQETTHQAACQSHKLERRSCCLSTSNNSNENPLKKNIKHNNIIYLYYNNNINAIKIRCKCMFYN
jgi:hypothetical protein